MSHKLEKKIIIKGQIIAQSGIMVGGSSSAFEIGGTDKQVIRNPLTKMPYIPGSSIKGKMRSLIELSMGTISQGRNESYGPTHVPSTIAAQLFGHIKHKQDNANKSQQASRILVRDAELNEGSAKELEGKTELLYTEVKAENSIDRITSAANPRFFERVPKGARFDLNMVINVFSHDTRGDEFLDTTFNALKLVQDDYLGGGGSRGNGQIKFNITSVVERTAKFYSNANVTENDISDLIPEELKAKS